MSALRWTPPTPDEELAEWREAIVPVEGDAGRGWMLEAYPDGRLWAWRLWACWPALRPQATDWAGSREQAMAACEEAARRQGVTW
jgi:hypothetical protein